MTTLKKLQTIFNSFKSRGKLSRHVTLNNIKVENGILYMTDFENFLSINYMTDKENGIYKIEGFEANEKLDVDINDFSFSSQIGTIDSTLTITKKQINELMPFISKDETRPYLTGMCWSGSEIVETNGYVMKILKSYTENKNENKIIPSNTLKLLKKLMTVYKFDSVNIYFDSMGYFEIKCDYFQLSGKCIDRSYPKYKAIIPVKTNYCLTINESAIKELNYVKKLVDETGKIILKNINDELFLTVKDYKISIGFTDYKDDIGFNVKYFEKILKGKKGDIKLGFNNNLSPFIYEDEYETSLIMPLKIG